MDKVTKARFQKKATACTLFQEAGVVAISKTCFTMATDGILETLATKYPQVISKAGYLWQRQ